MVTVLFREILLMNYSTNFNHIFSSIARDDRLYSSKSVSSLTFFRKDLVFSSKQSPLFSTSEERERERERESERRDLPARTFNTSALICWTLRVVFRQSSMACSTHIFNGHALNTSPLMNVPAFVCGIITRVFRPPFGICWPPPTLLRDLERLILAWDKNLDRINLPLLMSRINLENVP